MKKHIIKNLLREPLTHFLLIGAVLFSFYVLTREQGNENPKRIAVDSAQIGQLASNFKRTWMRPPTEGELSALIENHVREEVFYREAMAMGLDQDDPIVRRRMLTKLEFLLEDLTAEEATDDVLSAFLQEHPEQFRIQPKVSFQHVYINADKHQDPESDAEKLLESLHAGASSESLGDHTMLPVQFEMATQTEIAYSFGERFAEDIVLQEPGGWRGPVYSPYGVHLLKITEHREARLPALAEIRNIVEREYQVQHSKEQKDLVYKMLRESYDISIEPLAAEVVPTDKTLAAIQVSQQK